MRRLALGPLLSVLLLAVAGTVRAQTGQFGKNKIQYRDFDWRVLAGEHVDVYHYPEEEAVARLTLAYAERSYRYLERKFRHHPFDRIPLIVYSSGRHFEQTNVFPGFIPEGVLGFTEYLKGRIALPFRGDYAQFRHTLRHELVHVFQLSKLAETRALRPERPRFSPQNVHWWTEGLAEYWSGEQTVEDRMYVRDLVLHARLPSIRQFTRMRSFIAYPLGGELHAYLAARFGEGYIIELYEDYWKYDSFDAALAGVLGVDLDRLDREWRRALERRFFPGYSRRPSIGEAAERLIVRSGANFQPTLYVPPGGGAADLFFLSPRSGYTNLYRAQLGAGEAGVETVVEGERRAEFESFHAYESGIDVSGAGVIAFVSQYLERDALFLWDLERREVVGRYQWPDLVALRSPAWDPTARRLVFEGLSTRGFSDLYILDFDSQRRSALTGDRYRDRDPDWSPDGGTIVFASDRTAFGADGHTNLFLADVESGRVRHLTYGEWNDRDPRWSHDGQRIAFSSDRAGSYDLYVVDRDGRGRRVTGMTGGAFDPVWLPGDTGVVFTGFGDGGFRIYRHTFTRDTLAYPAVSPPADAPRVAAAAAAAADTLPSARPWRWSDPGADALDQAEPARYSGWESISLDFAGGNAVLAPGIGSAQGGQFLATDMLGDHAFYGGISSLQARDVNDVLDNFSGRLLYVNRSRRLNFGAGVYRFRGRFYDIALDHYREASYGGYFLASYPFSRYRRLEFQLGLARSRRDDLPDTFGFGVVGPPGDERDLTRDGLVATNHASYVKDNTLWLTTGPIDGERFRLTAGLATCFACAAPSDVTGESVTRDARAENYVLFGDYRRYFRTSLRSAYAVRAFAYFSDGAIPGRTVLGGPHRLRGYPRYSLAGSRAWLVNQEWRFPIVRGVSFGIPTGGLLPGLRFPGLQGAVFVDAGSSWLDGDSPTLPWGSYGLSLRTALGPPLVLRLDIGRRFRFGEKPPIAFGPGDDFDSTFFDLFFGYNY